METLLGALVAADDYGEGLVFGEGQSTRFRVTSRLKRWE